MPTPTSIPDTRTLPPELRALLETQDADTFEESLDALFAHRQQDLFRALGHLTRDLHESVVRLTRESGHPVPYAPDARRHLREALEMSANAAHESLAMAERLRPQASRLHDEACALTAAGDPDPAAARQLAQATGRFTDTCLADFTRLVEMQSWQDLSGQRLQQVDAFIDKVETALLELVHLTGSISGAAAAAEHSTQRATTQDDVDRLLSDFGF